MLVLLDRDGVINTDLKPHGTTHIDALEIYDFVPEAIYRLKKAGYRIAVITNQSAIEKGLMDVDMLQQIHSAIQARCQSYHSKAVIDAFYYCSDHPDSPTRRRKPQAGMIFEALHDFGVRASETIFIGDSARDIHAALAADCKPCLVKTGNGATTDAAWEGKKPYIFCDTLADVARYLTK